MQIIDSLHSIFDKKIDACNCTHNTWEVHEDNETSFKKMTFYCDGACFGVIHNEFYKDIKSVTEKRSSFLKDFDCDGIAFYGNGDILQLLFVDLKSSFSEQNITKAFRQDFYSLLKMHMLLSLCEGYRLSSIAIRFFAACPPCKSRDDETRIKDIIFLTEELGEKRFENKYLMGYFKKEGFSCQLKDIPFVKDKHLNEELMEATIQFQIYTPDNVNDREGLMELSLN